MTTLLIGAYFTAALAVACWPQQLNCGYEPVHHNGWHEAWCYRRYAPVTSVSGAVCLAALYGLAWPPVAVFRAGGLLLARRGRAAVVTAGLLCAVLAASCGAGQVPGPHQEPHPTAAGQR